MGEGDLDKTASDDRSMNLKQAALSLGVHYMTVYRYVRQGRLGAHRVGTEWRVPRAALVEFRETTSEPAEQPPAAPADWAARLESCMLAGDEVVAWQVLELALGSGRSPEYCYTEVLATALASIGERWVNEEIDIADQYVATAVATRLIARLGARFRRRGRSRGTFVFGAPEGELHSVPIAIVADLVRLGGFEVLELGANVPATAFASCAVRVPRLVAIGLGVSHTERRDSVATTVEAIRAVAQSVPIVIGGFAANDLADAGIAGVTAFARDGGDALRLLEGFANERSIRRVS